MKKFFDTGFVPEAMLMLIILIPFVEWKALLTEVPGAKTIGIVIKVLSVIYVLAYILYNGEKAGKEREAAVKRAKEQKEIQRKEEFKKEYLSFRAEMAQRMQKYNEQEEG